MVGPGAFGGGSPPPAAGGFSAGGLPAGGVSPPGACLLPLPSGVVGVEPAPAPAPVPSSFGDASGAAGSAVDGVSHGQVAV